MLPKIAIGIGPDRIAAIVDVKGQSAQGIGKVNRGEAAIAQEERMIGTIEVGVTANDVALVINSKQLRVDAFR